MRVNDQKIMKYCHLKQFLFSIKLNVGTVMFTVCSTDKPAEKLKKFVQQIKHQDFALCPLALPLAVRLCQFCGPHL